MQTNFSMGSEVKSVSKWVIIDLFISKTIPFSARFILKNILSNFARIILQR